MRTITKEVFSPALCFMALVAVFGNVCAQELTFYGALTTDYVYRGVSNSDEQGAVQLSLDISTETGFFGGVWASTTDITSGDRNRAQEVDYYLGYVRFFENDWSASLSINRYTYPGSDGNVNYDFNEWTTLIGFRDRFWFEIDYTDSLLGHSEPAYNLEALASWPLPASLALTVGIGYFDRSRFAGSAYSFWQIGVSRPVGWTTFDLRYYDTSNVRTIPGSLADPRVVLTISVTF